MAQSNSSTNDEKIQFYSKFDVDHLQKQLSEEKSYQNRNIIRQVIRQKQKNKDCPDSTSPVAKTSDDNIESIDELKKILDKTTDYFEQCRIRSKILHLKKSESKSDKQEISTNIECSVKNINQVPESKKLIYDETSLTPNVFNCVIKINDSVELLWIMPFKILKSIDYRWHFNENNINFCQKNNFNYQFDGSRAIFKLHNVDLNDSGMYKIIIDSQRLKRKSLKFNLIINNNNEEKLSSIILEEPEIPVKEVKPDIVASSPNEHNGLSKPRSGIHRNRNNRFKTVMGDELLSGLRATANMTTSQHNISNNNDNRIPANVLEPNNVSQPRPNVRRFNRSATTAKDVILAFCQRNTEEYYQYGVSIVNLSSSWSDGLAFCALIHHFHPEAFDFSTLNKTNRKYNFELAFNTAEQLAEIYQLLDVEDMMMMDVPDWKCVFTYVQCFYKTFRTHPLNRLKTVAVE